MPLIIFGRGFVRDLEQAGALGCYMPLEGGFEGRYQRRLRTAGYHTYNLSAPGLGDVAAYLMGVHGVRPPHLGKKTIGQVAMVGQRYFLPPMARYQLEALPGNSKGLVLWILEGNILSRQEVEYLIELPKLEPRIKVVLEMGGERYFRWQPLEDCLTASVS